MPLPAVIILILFAFAAGWIVSYAYLKASMVADPGTVKLTRRDRELTAYALEHLAEVAAEEKDALRDAGFRVLDPVSTDAELRRLKGTILGS
ncbi:hypothetical protein LG293_16560 (plasmid) [Citricoccus nitrophenolicus]